MNVPENLKYTKEHEWLKIDGGDGVVGITDYAQSELGDIIYLDVNISIGNDVSAGQSLGSIEAVKTVSEVFSPISGTLIDINLAVNDNPSVVNQDPYGAGWLIKIEPNNQDEISNLLDAGAYKELIGV